MHFRSQPLLRISFWIKLAFILIEVALAIVFGVLQHYDMWNAAGIVEWVIAAIYTFWVLSFTLDFLPAVQVRKDRLLAKSRAPDMMDMGQNGGSVHHLTNENGYGDMSSGGFHGAAHNNV